MKKNVAPPVLATLFSFMLVSAACGAASTIETAGPDSESRPTAEPAIVEGEATTSTANSSTDAGGWVVTDDQLTNFQPTNDGSVEKDPTNGAQVIVTFSAGFAPCAGGRAMATETADAVVVTIEVGLHNNVAAMTCPAGTDDHQLVLPLKTDVGDRTLSVDGAS